MTPLEEKEIMQKHFIRKHGVRSSVLDTVIEEIRKLKKEGDKAKK